MKYYFWILGCAMNYSDAERMATVLDSLGYSRTLKEKEADLFIVISCSVRQSAILKIYGKVKELNEYKATNPNFKTILSGCVLEKDRKKLKKVFDIMLETEEIPRLPELLKGASPSPVIPSKCTEPRNPIENITERPLRQGRDDSTESTYLSITPHYDSAFRAYVPISTGCDNFCSYCAVPYTRGREKSRPMPEIVEEIKELIKRGFREITILGQNVNSYGHDITGNKKDNSPFIDLLTELDQIPGEYRIYFYSNHPKDMSDDLIHTISRLKHFPRYIHLPLQSGNDNILRKMNRHNTKKEYLELVKRIRKIMPDVTLTTDIIVGFPGESEKQFQDTVEVMEVAEYDMAFIAQYSERSGTVAAKLDDDITKEEKKSRELVLQEIVKRTVLAHNQKLLGTVQRVLIDETKGDKYFGRTEGYKVVEIGTGQPLEIGQFIDIKIGSVSSWKLFGIPSITPQS